MKKCIPLCLALLGLATQAEAQETFSPVLVAAPSLHITPDARAAALGEQGVATSADTYAQFWNPAKYPFTHSRAGIGLSYTPWLSKVAEGISLMQIVGHYGFGEEQRHNLGASLRYFSLSKVTQWDDAGRSLGEVSPNELALDLSYAIKLSPEFALATTLRYVRSNQEVNTENKAASAVVADLSAYMNKYIRLGGRESRWTAGLSIKNIGSKLSLDGGNSQYLPTNLALGTGLLYPIDPNNAIAFSLEAGKLLVPSYPRREAYTDDASYDKVRNSYNEGSAISGMFRSFGDAPGGFGEELKEIRWSLGAEYNHKDKFFLRLGYSYLSPSKGRLQALTAGAGVKFGAVRVDASYLLSTVQHNPLDQSLRFSLGLELDALKHMFK